MINPQLENGHIEINNENAEQFGKLHLSGSEWQILWVVLRKTWGWKKKHDSISLTQFEKLTGLTRKSVCRAIDELVSKSILVSKKTLGITQYSFNKHYDEWKVVSKMTLVSKMSKGSVKNVQKVVSKMTHTKETITKEIIQKKDTIKKTYFISLTENEKNKISADLKVSLDTVNDYCEQADSWSNGKGNKMLNWYLTIRGWISRDIKSGKVSTERTMEEQLHDVAIALGFDVTKFNHTAQNVKP